MKKQKIGIYGGTFSPPHLGHVRAAESFAAKISPDKLLIIPDFLPPHKNIDGGAAEGDRLRMCELAFSHIENAEISTIEIERGGKSYTALTLTELSGDDRELYFLVGTDMFLSLDMWYAPETIFKLATICYVRRESNDVNAALIKQKTDEYREKYGARIICVESDAVEISSSEIRELLGTSRARAYLSKSVYEYITEKELYR